MNDYWKKRVLANEEKTQRYAASAVKRQQKLYRQTYQEIEKQLESLALELLESGQYGSLTRSQLWQFKKYVDLQQVIGNLMEGMSNKQISITTEVLRQAFEETIGSTLEGLKSQENIAYSLLNKSQVDQVLNTAWSGKHYSQRIYGTNSKIAERMKKDMTDMIILGKNTTQIKRKLMDDLNVSFSYADRLVRTEASHIYNEAAKKAYEEAKVEEVEVLVENDSDLCPECQALAETNGGKYRLGSEPRLPLHPNCRCCYAPIVDLSVKKLGDA